MSEHTKGKMELSANIVRLEGGEGAIADTLEISRRIFATWNACEGMATEHVELLGSFSELIRGSNSQLVRNAKELAAARALLREALDTIEEFPDEDHEIADRIKNYLDACDKPGATT